MVKVGDVLIHPVHGEITVVHVGNKPVDEFVNGDFHEGVVITCNLPRFIPSIQWRTVVDGEYVSQLIFHEKYLERLEVK